MEEREVSGGWFKEGERGEEERREVEGREAQGREGVFTIFHFNDFSIQPVYKFSLFINNSLTLNCRASCHSSQVAIPLTHAALGIGSR